MMVTKKEVLHLIEDLSADELQVVYTFINEFRVAEGELEEKQRELDPSLKERESELNYFSYHIPPHQNPFRRRRPK